MITISNSEYVYVRVQGLVWEMNGLAESTNVRANVGSSLDELYFQGHLTLPLLVDFKGIDSIADHSLDILLTNISSSKRPIVFLNVGTVESLLYPLIPASLSADRFYDKQTKKLHISVYQSFHEIDLASLVEELIMNEITDIVKKSFQPFDKVRLLNSTPIHASGIFNANTIIANPISFYWVSLALNDIFQRAISNAGKLKYEIKLLSVSLRSAPFASIISQLNQLPLETIDHLGPRHKIFDLDILPNLVDKKRYSYIYIGDFCFGGTEIKIAKTYAQFAQSKFEFAVVIASLFKSETFFQDFDLHCILDLVELSKDINAQFMLQ